MYKLKISLVKSPIGYPEDQWQTLRSLGLKKLHQSVIRTDSESVRGMLYKVRHLIKVELVEDEAK